MSNDNGKDEGGDLIPLRPLPEKRPANIDQAPKRNQIQSDRITRAKARHRVLELAAAGLTAEQIAWETGKTRAGVNAIINKQLKKWSEENAGNLAEYRQMKLFELDQLKRAVWPLALKGDHKAVREAVKIVTLQAGISGAGAAQKHEHDHRVGRLPVDAEEVDRMEQAWLNAAPEGPLPEQEELNTDSDLHETAEVVEGTVVNEDEQSN